MGLDLSTLDPASTSLNFIGTNISDEDLARIQGFTRLERLYLEGVAISGPGLTYIKGLTTLKLLYLNGTDISDEDLVHLAGLTALEELDVRNTRVTDAGREAIRVALPNCRVDSRLVDADRAPLLAKPGLERLDLSGIDLSKVDLAPLLAVPILERLDVSGNASNEDGQ